MAKIMIASAALIVLLASGCATACRTGLSRCNGAVLEVCGPNKRWQRGVDCSELMDISSGRAAAWHCEMSLGGGRCAPGN